MSTFELIGISGKAGSGKDWVYEHHLRPLGYSRWALADHFKISIVGRGTYTYDEVFRTKPPHVRDRLQKMGTEEGRLVYGENVWCATALSWMQHLSSTLGLSKWVITDCRFVNEVEFIKRHGGQVLRLVAPTRVEQSPLSDEARLHVSEIELDTCHSFNAYLPNDPEHAESLHENVVRALNGYGIADYEVRSLRERERNSVSFALAREKLRLATLEEELRAAGLDTQSLSAC